MTQTAPELPPWERELRAAAGSSDHSISPFTTAPFVGALQAAVGSESPHDLRARLRSARLRVDQELKGDRGYDELRARIAASYVLWRIDEDRQITDKDFEAIEDLKSAPSVERRTFRQGLAHQRYRASIGGEDYSLMQLQKSNVTAGAQLATRAGWRDALIALLYSIIDKASITTYWDPTTNTVQYRKPATEAADVPSADTVRGEPAQGLAVATLSEGKAVNQSRTTIISDALDEHSTRAVLEPIVLTLGSADPADEIPSRDPQEDRFSPAKKMGAAVKRDGQDDVHSSEHQCSETEVSSPDPVSALVASESRPIDNNSGAAGKDREKLSRLLEIQEQLERIESERYELIRGEDRMLRDLISGKIKYSKFRQDRRTIVAELKASRRLISDLKTRRDNLKAGAEESRTRVLPPVRVLARGALVGVLVSALVAAVVLVALHESQKDFFVSTTDIDPVVAVRTTGYWKPGWGPMREGRPADDPTPRFIDPSPLKHFDVDGNGKGGYGGYLLPGEATTTASFINLVDGEYDSKSDVTTLSEGRHEVRVAIVNDAPYVSGENIQGARLNLGVTPATDRSAVLWAIYAHLSAENAETVWSGTTVTPDCFCTVAIDPASVRVSSAAMDERRTLDPAVLDSSGTLIGSETVDGILLPGRANLVAVTATIVVSAR